MSQEPSSRKNKYPKATVDAIDAVLPQTQCQLCEYKDCRDYAIAITEGEEIHRCMPGGEDVLYQLAALCEQDPTPYLDKVKQQYKPPQVVSIQEDVCIGCTKCIQACPVDAIIGTSKQMHSILSTECNGCELCIEPCPVDCIDIHPVNWSYTTEQSEHWRTRYLARTERLEKREELKQQQYRQSALTQTPKEEAQQSRQQAMQEAMARVQAKRQAREQLKKQKKDDQ